MNPDNGHLVRDITKLSEEERENYTPILDSFVEDAKKALGNKDEVYVDMNKGGNLQDWARKRKLFKRHKKG